MNSNTSGRRKMFASQGDMPPDTMILHTNFHLVLTRESLTKIANKISKKTGKKMDLNGMDALVKFVSRLPESRFYNKQYDEVHEMIADDFINRRSSMLKQVQEQDFDTKLSGVDRDTDSGTISDYEKKEVFQFTPDENAYKFTAHQDRRGNSIIDQERVAGKRSSPDNILPLDSVKSQYMVNNEIYKVMKLMSSFMAPESIESTFSRIQSNLTNYNNISLVHQLVQFDSRNRLPATPNPNDYKWNVHTSGQPGKLGDIRILDTLQQVIRLKIFPFWAPVNPSIANPYAKIRLLIREFIAQSVTVSEFNDPSQSVPTLENYHFEFEVRETVGDRIYLVPAQDIYDFRKPMARVETITTNFRSPFGEEVFDPDSGIFTITYGNPTLFTITNPAVHLLNTGDLVYVYNSDSGDELIDDEINNPLGYNITKISATQFTIPVDSSALVGSETNIHVYYGSKRVFFQIEFLCLEQ